MPEQIVYLPDVDTARRPRTTEECQIIYDLDLEFFDQLTQMWVRCSVKRDPAYLVWGVRRHFFWHFWGRDTEFPEARPSIGSPPVLCYDKSIPWYVPGLEKIRRESYPKGWDDYVNHGVKPVRSSLPKTNVTASLGRSAPPAAVPQVKEESAQLVAARKKLQDLEEAKTLREIEERTLVLQLEDAKTKKRIAEHKKVLNAMEAEKAAIQARAVGSGKHEFGNPTTLGPSATPRLGESKWNVPAKQPASAHLRDKEFPRLERISTQQKTQIVLATKANLPMPGQIAVQRERRVLGWEHTREKKPGGTRQGIGRVRTEVIAGKNDVKLKAKKDLSCYNCGAVGHYRSDCPKIECQNCGNKGHDVKKCPKVLQRSGLCSKCSKPGHKAIEFRSGKSHLALSKEPHSKQLTLQISEDPDVGRSGTASAGWTYKDQQGHVKIKVEETENTIERNRESMMKMNDGGRPTSQLHILSQQSRSVHHDQERAVQIRSVQQDGNQNFTAEFQENSKKRKVPMDSKDVEHVQKKVLLETNREGEANARRHSPPALQMTETASKAVEDEWADGRTERHKTAELRDVD